MNHAVDKVIKLAQFHYVFDELKVKMLSEHNIAHMREDTQDLTPDDWRRYQEVIFKCVAYHQEAASAQL